MNESENTYYLKHKNDPEFRERRREASRLTTSTLDTVNPMLAAKTPQEEAQILAGYERDMKVALWFAYLPDAERAANINTLTKRQRSMAERVWRERHYGAHGANESDCG